MVQDAEIVDLLNKAQATLPENSRLAFIESATARIGSFLKDHKNALIGTGVGYVIGELVDQVPLVHLFTGSHGAILGAAVGAWVGHGKDQQGRATREQIVRIVAEELKKVKAV